MRRRVKFEDDASDGIDSPWIVLRATAAERANRNVTVAKRRVPAG